MADETTRFRIVAWTTKQHRNGPAPLELWEDEDGKYTIYDRFDDKGQPIPSDEIKRHERKVESPDAVLKHALTMRFSAGMQGPGGDRRVIAPRSLYILDKSGASRSLREYREWQLTAVEGMLALVTVGRRARSGTLRSSKLDTFRQLHGGRLFCEVCRGSNHSSYGAYQEQCIECHHVEPIRERPNSGSATVAADLLLVCANCHSVLERSRPRLSVAEVQALGGWQWSSSATA